MRYLKIIKKRCRIVNTFMDDIKWGFSNNGGMLGMSTIIILAWSQSTVKN